MYITKNPNFGSSEVNVWTFSNTLTSFEYITYNLISYMHHIGPCAPFYSDQILYGPYKIYLNLNSNCLKS